MMPTAGLGHAPSRTQIRAEVVDPFFPNRASEMPTRGAVALILSMAPVALASAQPRALDDVAVRRTAVYSALAARAAREGVALDVEMCSVVRAMGIPGAIRAAAPSAIANSFIDDHAQSCPSSVGARKDGPWVPFVEVVSAQISDSTINGSPSASVELRVWTRRSSLDSETYDFIIGPDSLWTPASLRRGSLLINLAFSPDPNVLILFNGQIVQAATAKEMLAGVRGQLVDSIVVFGANDSTYTNMCGSRCALGGIIIGTRQSGRRP